MWLRVDRLEPAVALGLGAALGAALWWAVAAALPGLAVWAGVALLAGAVALAFSGQPVAVLDAIATGEPAVAPKVAAAPTARVAPEGAVAATSGDASAIAVAEPPVPVVAPQPVPMPPGIGSLETYRFAVVTVNERGAVLERREAEALSFAEDLGDGVRLDMTFVPAGRFLMGSPKGEAERYADEDPQHEVSLGPFFVGRYPVTQAQWRAVARWPKAERDLKPEPSRFKGDDRPVESISWHEAVEFCRRLSQRTRRTYALPSEAQWEYACRAGTETPFHFGPTITPEVVNYDGNYPYGAAAKGAYRKQTTAVGSFGVANEFGLFDMHGNVWEWCQDVWHEDYKDAPRDGSPWETTFGLPAFVAKLIARERATRRVLRGGAWIGFARYCRSAVRYWVGPELRGYYRGFRVVCAVSRTQS